MFIVVYDDRNGLCVPQVWDTDCEGAICTGRSAGTDTVALFDSRKAARAAIDISAKFAELCKSQGKPHNEDYLKPYRKNLHIQPCGGKVNTPC